MKFRAMSRQIHAIARKDCVSKTSKFYLFWKNYYEITKERQVFGVKVDVTDAFGNINISKQIK